MKIIISILFFVFGSEVRAQDISACKESEIFKMTFDHFQTKKEWSSKENWIAREVELNYHLNQLGLQLILRHNMVTHDTKIVCYSSRMRVKNPINRSFLFPVSVEFPESISYWILHLLIKPDGTIGYWFQPESHKLANLSRKKEGPINFYDISPSLGATFMKRITPDSFETIKVIFDR
jgi:hypothetical protein